MRHLVKGRKLGRTTSHRAATLSALSVALIKEHRIVTTLPKAKELRTYIEPLITKAKEDTSHNRRQVFSKLKDKQAVSHLFGEVSDKVGDRPGGYTRVVKMGSRAGDSADMAVIELVDYNDIKPEDSTKSKRTRRAGKSSSTSSGSSKKSKAKSETKAAEAKKETKEDQSSKGKSEEE
jgi:large subunit ribosomal protein L17